MPKDIRFELYRYQILPRDRYFQGQLFSGIKTLEELLEKKNEIFRSAIKDTTLFPSSKTDIKSKLIMDEDDFLLCKFAAFKSIKREVDFNEEEMENQPSFYVGIWNHPEKQLIAIQKRRDAFQDTATVINTISTTINLKFENDGLRLHIEPLFREEEFWKIIDKYKGKIRKCSFDLITPNMANISGALSDDLKDFAKTTNTSKTTIGIVADPASALKIERSDKQVEGLVRYASAGGGNIAINVKGIRRTMQTAQTKKSFEIDQIEISHATREDVVRIIKDSMS
jgi:hypothetical protein